VLELSKIVVSLLLTKTLNTMEINREYLENLCQSLKSIHTTFSFDRGGRIASNMYNLGNDIYYFQQHNFLPAETDDILNGHYTIIVNAKTFNYFIFQHANFGSFSYVTESKDKEVYFKDSLPKNSRIRMDFVVADALLGFYFYDGDHINNQGKNLFPTKYCLTNDLNDYDTKEKRAIIFDKHDWEDIDINYSNEIKKLT
jgi:hypothetical protein